MQCDVSKYFQSIDHKTLFRLCQKKIKTKLKKGTQQIQKLIENSSSLSGEIYLLKNDGGQQKLILKHNREQLNKTDQLIQIKKAAEEQLKEIDKQKLKTIAIYK